LPSDEPQHQESQFDEEDLAWAIFTVLIGILLSPFYIAVIKLKEAIER